MRPLVCGIFFLTGAAGLIFETLWFHQAGLALGNSVWASSLVLAGFMGGLGLGNALAARLGDHSGAPLKVYAALEIAVAIAGIGLAFLLPAVGGALAKSFGALFDQPWALNLLRLTTAFVLLLVPSTAMGATLPLLVRVLSASDTHFGGVLGRLYGWNTMGAVAGVVVADFALIGWLGIRGSALLAGALEVIAALVAIALAHQITPMLPRVANATKPRETLTRGTYAWLFLAFTSGFALLSLEVVWFRLLSLFVRSEATSFALMLAVVLAGIALGGLAASIALRRMRHPNIAVAPLVLAAGTLCALTYAAMPWIVPADGSIARRAGDILWMAIPLMLPVSFFSGALFTFVGSALRHDFSTSTRAAGWLTLANTGGSALGSLCAGFLFLPQLGVEYSIFVIALLYTATGIVLLRAHHSPSLAWVAAIAPILALGLFPFGAMRDAHLSQIVDRFDDPGEVRVVAVRETPIQTIAYLESQSFGQVHTHRLITDGYSMSGSHDVARRYMKLYVYWPVAVQPNLESALLISYGVGSTAKALTDTESLKRIDIVDISRDILELNEIVYPDKDSLPLNDPRVRTHIEDGRYFLESTKRRFDLITGEPPPPTARGVVNLYTQEHFELVREHLTESGIATYWLPIPELGDRATLAILRGFCGAFADCSLWHGMGGNLMMVGTRGLDGPVSADHFAAQWQNPKIAAEMAALGFEHPEQLGALFIGDALWLERFTQGIAPLRDNWPKRILARNINDAPYSPIYGQFWDVRAARQRFVSSALIERLWPPSLRKESEQWFEFQNMINAYSNGFFRRQDSPFPQLDQVLNETNLRAPARWLLGSNADLERIVKNPLAGVSTKPQHHYFQAVAELVDRDFASAAENFRKAEATPNPIRDAFRFRIYALCMADRCDEAERLAQERRAQLAQQREPLPPFWIWMKDRFDLDARGSTKTALAP